MGQFVYYDQFCWVNIWPPRSYAAFRPFGRREHIKTSAQRDFPVFSAGRSPAAFRKRPLSAGGFLYSLLKYLSAGGLNLG